MSGPYWSSTCALPTNMQNSPVLMRVFRPIVSPRRIACRKQDSRRNIGATDRRFPESLLQGVDLVVHLAAVSNDPMGKRFERVTGEINHRASVQIARLGETARGTGLCICVELQHVRFVRRKPSEGRRPPQPADGLRCVQGALRNRRSGRLQAKTTSSHHSGSRRPVGCPPGCDSTWSLNDFIACAVSSGEITVLSDGTPWRPLINVRDMARAIHWACRRSPDDGGEFLAVNVGSESWNYQVKDLARAVASIIPGTRVSINPNAQPDRRSYRVDFSLFRELAPRHQPLFTLEQTIRELTERIGINEILRQQLQGNRVHEAQGYSKTISGNGGSREELFWA